MSAPDEYTRSTLLLRNGELRALNDADAERMLGVEITARVPVGVEHPGATVVLTFGQVTKAEVIEDGRRLVLIVESGGRHCHLCGRVYPEAEAGERMAKLAHLRASGWAGFDGAAYQTLPGRAQVCRDSSDCLFWRMDDPPPNDGESACRAGCQH